MTSSFPMVDSGLVSVLTARGRAQLLGQSPPWWANVAVPSNDVLAGFIVADMDRRLLRPALGCQTADEFNRFFAENFASYCAKLAALSYVFLSKGPLDQDVEDHVDNVVAKAVEELATSAEAQVGEAWGQQIRNGGEFLRRAAQEFLRVAGTPEALRSFSADDMLRYSAGCVGWSWAMSCLSLVLREPDASSTPEALDRVSAMLTGCSRLAYEAIRKLEWNKVQLTERHAQLARESLAEPDVAQEIAAFFETPYAGAQAT